MILFFFGLVFLFFWFVFSFSKIYSPEFFKSIVALYSSCELILIFFKLTHFSVTVCSRCVSQTIRRVRLVLRCECKPTNSLCFRLWIVNPWNSSHMFMPFMRLMLTRSWCCEMSAAKMESQVKPLFCGSKMHGIMAMRNAWNDGRAADCHVLSGVGHCTNFSPKFYQLRCHWIGPQAKYWRAVIFQTL